MTAPSGPPLSRRGRQALVAFASVNLLAFLLLGAFAYWTCDLATYNCPALGCGDVPTEHCHAALLVMELLVPVLVILFGVAVLFLWRSSRSRGPPISASR
jgi:hypothetical protein